MSTIRLAGLISLLLVTQHSLADEKHLEHDAVMKAVDLTKKEHRQCRAGCWVTTRLSAQKIGGN